MTKAPSCFFWVSVSMSRKVGLIMPALSASPVFLKEQNLKEFAMGLEDCNTAAGSLSLLLPSRSFGAGERRHKTESGVTRALAAPGFAGCLRRRGEEEGGSVCRPADASCVFWHLDVTRTLSEATCHSCLLMRTTALITVEDCVRGHSLGSTGARL